MQQFPRRVFRHAAFASLLLALASNSLAQAPIVQPGAPGSASRNLSATEAVEIADTSYSAADVRFMQDMIPHHRQALVMAELVADRTNRPELVDVAGRIDASQQDEIGFMETWLSERGEALPENGGAAGMDGTGSTHAGHGMMGMATPAQLEELTAAEGTAFDRLFLELMIRHHEGAVEMVEMLHGQPGAAYDPVLFEFTNDVTNDQTAEIERMSALLASLSDDPRVGLVPGIDNAGEASMNMRLIGSLPKPPGFFDPENPAGLPPERPSRGEDNDGDDDAAAADAGDDDEADDGPPPWNRSPLLSFSNTDMAFFDDVMITGSYHGFSIYRLGAGRRGLPELVSSVVCPGGQGDVSVVGNLLIMSVEQTRGRLDCGLEGISEDVSPERFRGIRIFDIGDLAHPVQVGAVQTCRGSHTHSVVSGPGDTGTIVVYNSGTSRVREEEELEGCIGAIPGDDRTALFRIDVIEIPVADPAKARIVSSPAVFADPESGVLAGLWRGGDHGDDTQETSTTDQCHDITVFPSKNLAAGACSGNGILFDITDPLNPVRIDAVIDEGFAYWHSATFNNDGTKVIFTDEWGGGGRPRCRPQDPLTWGADAIYDIVDGMLEFRAHFKMPAPQTEEENCVAHNGSIVPVPGRDIFVQAWYQGGISVVDFTDSANPIEIAFFDRGPIDGRTMIVGGYWSAYWFDGAIYGTEIVRGLDMFRLTPSEHLTANEISAAVLADEGSVFNPQQQFPVRWPAAPVVALAYLDQLERDGAVAGELLAGFRRALESAEARIVRGRSDTALSEQLRAFAADLPGNAVPGGTAGARTLQRIDALSGVARELAARLEAQ